MSDDGGVQGGQCPFEREPDALTLAQVDALLAFLPLIEAPDADFGEGPTLDQVDDKTLPGGPTQYSGLADRLMNALYENGFVFGFDWMAWDEGRRILADPELLAAADLCTVRKLLVALARADHFGESAFLEALEAGQIAAILRRLAVLRAHMASSDPVTDGG